MPGSDQDSIRARLTRDEVRQVWEAIDRGASPDEVVAAALEFLTIHDDDVSTVAGVIEAIGALRRSVRRLAASRTVAAQDAREGTNGG